MTRERRKAPTKGGVFGEANERGERWCEDIHAAFRRTADIERLPAYMRISGQSWYVDIHQDRTIRGLAFQLPGKDGQERWLGGCSDAWNDNAALIDMEVFYGPADTDDAMIEALVRGDDVARIHAEQSVEWSELYELEYQAEQKREELQEALKSRNASKWVRNKVWQLIEQTRKAVEKYHQAYRYLNPGEKAS